MPIARKASFPIDRLYRCALAAGGPLSAMGTSFRCWSGQPTIEDCAGGGGLCGPAYAPADHAVPDGAESRGAEPIRPQRLFGKPPAAPPRAGESGLRRGWSSKGSLQSGFDEPPSPMWVHFW